MTDHVRYERMAVGHVLGGLDEVDAAAFRAHLLGCADCRRRVNELRDIASDLAATEREERRWAAAGEVEVEARTAQDGGGAPEATEVDAAAFRAHLLDCADCRRRVNELREIASDLAATEREERRWAAAGEVEVEARTAQDGGGAPEATEVAPLRRWPWGVVVIGLVPLLVLGTLAWAVWQRAQTDLSAAVAESQQQVLEVLATGEAVQWTSVEPITGNIATDGETIAVNLSGLPDLRPDEALVVWLLGDQGESVTQTRSYLPSQVAGSLVAAIRQPPTAREFVVSIETDLTSLARPQGYRLLSGPLPEGGDES